MRTCPLAAENTGGNLLLSFQGTVATFHRWCGQKQDFLPSNFFGILCTKTYSNWFTSDTVIQEIIEWRFLKHSVHISVLAEAFPCSWYSNAKTVLAYISPIRPVQPLVNRTPPPPRRDEHRTYNPCGISHTLPYTRRTDTMDYNPGQIFNRGLSDLSIPGFRHWKMGLELPNWLTKLIIHNNSWWCAQRHLQHVHFHSFIVALVRNRNIQ